MTNSQVSHSQSIESKEHRFLLSYRRKATILENNAFLRLLEKSVETFGFLQIDHCIHQVWNKTKQDTL